MKNKLFLSLFIALYATAPIQPHNVNFKRYVEPALGAAAGIIITSLTMKIIDYKKKQANQSIKKEINTIESLFKNSYQTTIFKAKSIQERFADIGGYHKAKNQLQLLKNTFTQDSPLKIKLPSNIFITGDSGTGKTLLVKACAKEFNCPLIQTSIQNLSELCSKGKVSEFVIKLKKFGPSILLIDNLETITPGAGELLNQLIYEIETTQDSKQPILLACTTTNSFVLEMCKLSPEKVDLFINLEYPDIKERIEIIHILLKNNNYDPTIDIKRVAKASCRMTGSMIKQMINNAALLSLNQGLSSIGQAALYQARDAILFGSASNTSLVCPEETKVTAYHEAGHALVSILLSSKVRYFDSVTILPRTHSYWGKVLGLSYAPHSEIQNLTYSKHDYLDRMNIALAGRAAEHLVFNIADGSGTTGDYQTATQVALHMICTLGMTDVLGKQVLVKSYESYSQKTLEKIDEAVTQMIDQQYEITYNLLKENQDKLEVLTQALLEQETLYANEVYELLNMQQPKSLY